MSNGRLELTAENLRRVTHVVWDTKGETLSLKVAPQNELPARIYWPYGNNGDDKRITSKDGVLLAVELLQAVTGCRFLPPKREGDQVWFVRAS